MADKKILIGVILGLGLAVGLAWIPLTSESTIPPTNAVQNIEINGTWHNATSYAYSISDIWVNSDTTPNGTSFLIYKNVDETVNNSATLQNDDELCFDETPNKRYGIDVFIRVQSNPTADLQYRYTHSIGGSGNFFATGGWSSATASNPQNVNNPQLVNILSTQIQVFPDRGFYTNSGNAGTYCFQWAQNTATAVDTTILAGSWMKVSIID